VPAEGNGFCRRVDPPLSTNKNAKGRILLRELAPDAPNFRRSDVRRPDHNSIIPELPRACRRTRIFWNCRSVWL
jgi:hypothetical protein